jgi:hypothetical protein
MRRDFRRSLVGRAGIGAAFAVTLLACCGCSGEPRTYPVRGKVLYKGQPAAGAKVIFEPKNNSDPRALRPTATVIADGSFTLSSREPGDGAPAGEYAVLLIWPDEPARGRGLAVKQPSRDRLRGAYSNPDKPLRQVQITEGNNELPAFELR